MELKLPVNSVLITNEEELNIIGGSCTVSITRDLLSKDYCKTKAQQLINNGSVTGMSKTEIAQELYAHAVAHYLGSAIQACGVDMSFLLDHTIDGVQLDDNGDTWARKVGYAAVWVAL